MKLSDFRDEQALDLLAEIIEPAAEIMADKKISDILRSGKPIDAVKIMIKEHKQSVIAILAAMDNVPISEYHCNVFTLPARLIEVLNDKELMSFFTSQNQTISEVVSGSVTENIKELKK